jgi:hypothetical protein
MLGQIVTLSVTRDPALRKRGSTKTTYEMKATMGKQAKNEDVNSDILYNHMKLLGRAFADARPTSRNTSF